MIWCFEEARLIEALKEAGDAMLAAGTPTEEAERLVNHVLQFLRSDIALAHKLIVQSGKAAGGEDATTAT
jgi:hypothetical protein